MCVWFLGYSPIIFYKLSPFFFDLEKFFPISTGIDTLWVQLLLEFPTNHFGIMHICSTWSEDVRVVLRLSSYCSDLKVTSFTDKAMMLWDACQQLAFIMYNDLYLSDNN